MKYRYLVMDIPEYYPNGGLGDCIAGFETISQAEEFLKSVKNSYELRVIDLIEDVTEHVEHVMQPKCQRYTMKDKE